MVAILFLYVREVLGKGVGVDDVRGFDAMQDHVHDRDDVGERLLLLAVEGTFLKGAEVRGGQSRLGHHVVIALAEEARRTAGTVVEPLANPWPQHLHHGANQRTRGVVLAAVAAGVPHPLDLFLIQRRELVLLGLRTETEFVDVIDDLAEVISAADLVLYLPEDLADLVLNRVRPARPLLEAVEVREESPVDEIDEVVARQRPVVVERPILPLGRRPGLPTVGLVDDVDVVLALQRRLGGPVRLKVVKILQEQQPRSLLGVVEFRRAPRLFPEHIVDVLECLLK